MRSRVVLILTILGLAMAVSAAPLAAGTPVGTLDQQQTTFDNTHFVSGTVMPAQVFTAGLSGQLDHVDLYLSNYHLGGPATPPADDLTVEIWTVTSGAPGSPIPGASATVLAADAPLVDTWVQVPISAPSVAGTSYAIVLASPGTICNANFCGWIWLLDESAPYAGGGDYNSFDNGATWNPVVGNTEASDFAFRTYVTATPAATQLPNAAMTTSGPSSPLATLGFAALLIGALGTLAVVSSRRAVSRR